jgi:hypothetical protein
MRPEIIEMRPEIIDAEWPSVLEEKPMQKARRRRRRFGSAAVGMWSSRAQTATHHPEYVEFKFDAPNRKSVNDRGVLCCPVLVSADGHFVLGEYSVSIR